MDPREALPHDMEAERVVLGTLIVEPACIATAISLLRPEDFYKRAYRTIFGAMIALAEKGAALDTVTLADHLAVAGELSRVGGAAALSALVDGLPRLTAIDSWCNIIRDKSLLRRVAEAGSKMVSTCRDESVGGADALARAYRDILAVAGSEPGGFQDPNQDLKQGLAALETLSHGQKYGLRTGIRPLDRLLIGPQGGDLLIVGARPSVGKTALGVAIAESVAAAGGAVAFFSLEMTRQQIIGRRLCMVAEVALDTLLYANERHDTTSWGLITAAGNKLVGRPFFIDDSTGISVAQVAAKTRQLQMRHGKLALVVVDYLQLMRSGERAENRVREVAQIAHGLKNLSKEIKVPVLALCQLNRASEATRGKGRPSMHDLRESGDLEQDADVVILLHRANRQGVASTQQSDAVGEAEEEQPENNPECELEIIVDKQRNGPTGIVTMRFMRQFGRFYEIDRYSAKNISS